jgi:hypothetical protein
MSYWPERDFLIRHGNYFNTLITNSSLIITTRIRTIGQRVRHINSKLLHIVRTYSHVSDQFIDIAIGFLRTFNTDGDYNTLKRALQRRGIIVHDFSENDDNSSVEVQREEREPIRMINDPNLLLFIAHRELLRGDIDDNQYRDIRRWILQQAGLHVDEASINAEIQAAALERLRRPAPRSRSPVAHDMPHLESPPQRYPIDAFVENLITRPNIKITDWKQEKPDECPICCGECEENPLTCGHYVCSNCIVNTKKATCPCCRQDVALDIPVYQRLYNAIYN